MPSRGAYFVILVLAFIFFASPPADAFGFRIGPLHFGLPFGHRHQHHRPLYMHGNTNEAARPDSRQGAERQPTAQRQATLALLYPSRALPAIFQNVFWPAFSSPWPFGYETIFSTAFASAAADQSAVQCGQAIDANAMIERIRAEIGPSAQQMERLQRLGGAIGAAADYLSKSCPTEIPEQPTARLQLMDSQIEVLTMAIDMIHQPLQEFEQSLTREQEARFSGGAGRATASASQGGKTGLRSCGASSTAIDWSIDQIDKSVQPNQQQRPALGELQQAFGKAAGDLQAHCPSSVPQSAVARLETIESRLDATWRAILSIQVALNEFESKLSDDQKNRFKAMTFASQ
jgi:LTXXQ motif family protein